MLAVASYLFHMYSALLVFLAVFRGFWTLLIILGLVSAMTGGFLLVCGVPFVSHKLYKLGGAFLIGAGKNIDPCMYMCGCGGVCSVEYTARGKNECTHTHTRVAAVSCSYLSHDKQILNTQSCRCHCITTAGVNIATVVTARDEEELHSPAVTLSHCPNTLSIPPQPVCSCPCFCSMCCGWRWWM